MHLISHFFSHLFSSRLISSPLFLFLVLLVSFSLSDALFLYLSLSLSFSSFRFLPFSPFPLPCPSPSPHVLISWDFLLTVWLSIKHHYSGINLSSCNALILICDLLIPSHSTSRLMWWVMQCSAMPCWWAAPHDVLCCPAMPWYATPVIHVLFSASTWNLRLFHDERSIKFYQFTLFSFAPSHFTAIYYILFYSFHHIFESLFGSEWSIVFPVAGSFEIEFVHVLEQSDRRTVTT